MRTFEHTNWFAVKGGYEYDSEKTKRIASVRGNALIMSVTGLFGIYFYDDLFSIGSGQIYLVDLLFRILEWCVDRAVNQIMLKEVFPTEII